MTLYLSPDLTPDEIRKAKSAGIAGSSSAANSSPALMPTQVLNHIPEASRRTRMAA